MEEEKIYHNIVSFHCLMVSGVSYQYYVRIGAAVIPVLWNLKVVKSMPLARLQQTISLELSIHVFRADMTPSRHDTKLVSLIVTTFF